MMAAAVTWTHRRDRKGFVGTTTTGLGADGRFARLFWFFFLPLIAMSGVTSSAA
jgi:hypothetical protein